MILVIGAIGSWVLTGIVIIMISDSEYWGALIFSILFITSVKTGATDLRAGHIKWPLFSFAYLLPALLLVAYGIFKATTTMFDS